MYAQDEAWRLDDPGIGTEHLLLGLLREADGTAVVEVRPLTGRTNQIRVHLWHLGHPVCGDAVYLPGQALGGVQTLSPGTPPMCLHAWRILARHPLDHQAVEFTAPPPEWAA